MTGTDEVAGVAVSKPDKVMFPATNGTAAITKLDVARYYAGVAAVMLPHLRGRPVNMQRFPDGIEGPSFYEKKVPGHFPDFVATVEVNTSQGPQRQVVVTDQRTLVYLANQGCLTPHTWLSRSDDLDRPDQLIFDLDPSVPDLGMVRRATRLVGGLLNDLGLVQLSEDERFAGLPRARAAATVLGLRRRPRLRARGCPGSRRPRPGPGHPRGPQGQAG